MKATPIIRAMASYCPDLEPILVHTGQHYDLNMSDIFFSELELPQPNVNLEVGSGSHAWQTGQVMLRFEPVLLEYRPHWVVVVGDVNSTLACALVASKLAIPVAHVEAGLRSFDRTMPEEINRLLTDQMADLLFTPSADADENLRCEGIPAHRIHRVGNVMIDTLVRLLPKARSRWPVLKDRFRLDRYVLVTLHRPSNVDDLGTLTEILAGLTQISLDLPVVFPVHPRTRKRMAESGLTPGSGNMQLLDPLGYLDFLALQIHSSLVLTDSGGVQEESTYLGIPCLTARPNTERPITVTVGTNRLVESKRDAIVTAARAALNGDRTAGAIPELWDGLAATRIVQVLARIDSC